MRECNGSLWSFQFIVVSSAGMTDLVPEWVRLVQNGTNPRLFHIRFQYILTRQNVLKYDFPNLGQIWHTCSWASPTHGRAMFAVIVTHLFSSLSVSLLYSWGRGKIYFPVYKGWNYVNVLISWLYPLNIKNVFAGFEFYIIYGFLDI